MLSVHEWCVVCAHGTPFGMLYDWCAITTGILAVETGAEWCVLCASHAARSRKNSNCTVAVDSSWLTEASRSVWTCLRSRSHLALTKFRHWASYQCFRSTYILSSWSAGPQPRWTAAMIGVQVKLTFFFTIPSVLTDCHLDRNSSNWTRRCRRTKASTAIMVGLPLH
jgi:hypothetical protein